MRCLFLLLLLARVQAAEIDLHFGLIRGSSLADKLLAPLTVPGGISLAALQAWTRRIQVTWSDRRSPPFSRFGGYPSDEITRGLSRHQAALHSADGRRCWPSAAQPGYALTVLDDRHLAMAPLAVIDDSHAVTWPNPGLHWASFIAGPNDMKLGGLGEWLRSLELTWGFDDRLVVILSADDAAGAAAMREWLLNRQPLLSIAAAVGIDDAVFLARLLDGADRRLIDNTYRITRRVDPALRESILAFLTGQIDRQLDRHRQPGQSP